MKRAYALVVLLVLTSAYGLADSIIPNVTPLPVISPSLSTAVAHPGTTFSLAINVGGVSNLSGFQFSFSFNPAVISATSIAAGSFLFLLGKDVQVSVQCFIWGEVGEPLHAHRIFENRVSV